MPRLMHGDASWHFRANPLEDWGAGWQGPRGGGPVPGGRGAHGGAWPDPPPPYLPPPSRSRGGRRRSSELLLGEESEEERSTSRWGGDRGGDSRCAGGALALTVVWEEREDSRRRSFWTAVSRSGSGKVGSGQAPSFTHGGQ